MSNLTPLQERIQDDIRGLIKGEVYCDEITRQLYSTDAGILQVRPRGVIRPKDTKDIVACVHYATENKIPIHLRGSGTGTAGESLGEGLVLDFSRFMNRQESIGTDFVTVQPGISLRRLNTVLSDTQQRIFAPVCGFASSTTLGSILSRNGAGQRFLQYGLPSDFLLELEVVLANGDILTLNRENLPQAIEAPNSNVFRPFSPASAKPYSIVQGIALARGITLGKEHRVADSIYQVLSPIISGGTKNQYGEKNAAAGSVPPEEMRSLLEKMSHPPLKNGYCCNEILKGENGRLVDIARLITGSEGTLGIIVKAKIKTVPLPNRKAGAVLFFSSIEKAVQSLEFLLPQQPVLCELIDRRRLALMSETEPRLRHLLPVESEAVLLMELNAGDITEPEPADLTQQRLKQLIEFVQHKHRLCFHSIRIKTAKDFEYFDRFLEYSEHILFRMRGSFQPLPLFGDIAVPVTKIKEFIPELLSTLQRNEITASFSGHIGQGHLRVFPVMNLHTEGLKSTLYRLSEDVYALTGKFGGTVSSESGAGLLNSSFIAKQFPELLPVSRSIKEIFDPDNLLSPGNLISNDSQWTAQLRNSLTGNEKERKKKKEEIENIPNVSQLEMQLRWEPQTMLEVVRRCSGCGECFRNDNRSRLCPLFRSDRREENSPRAKANFIQGILNGELDLRTLTQEQTKELADSCFHCHFCRTECPAEVDIPQLAFRTRSAYTAAHGLSLDDMFWSRLDTVLDWASAVSRPVNWLTKNKFFRWVIEKLLQIPQERQLPRLAEISFLNRIRFRNFLTRSHRPDSAIKNDRVALFIDTYSNHFDTGLADSAVRILEEQGLYVLVPLRQRPSGLISFTLGNRDETEFLAKQNTALFADLIRQGYTVVTLEPASASCLVQDYPWLTKGEDTALLSANTVDFCTFLLHRKHSGLWKQEFNPVHKTIGYHTPCRSITGIAYRIDIPSPAEELLCLIPGLEVHHIEQGCCGAAGTFGFKRKNYRQSLRIGMGLFRELRSEDIECGVSDCNVCRLQMEHGSKKKTLHPIHLFAEAWGLR